ncbi:Acetyltransferase (GNAT) family protein [Variovorax sp. PBS-H4]|uniref:GNAT family N-acetyltransferase n=1 Tax=Variovorax sp. PBS-H4 TaxID=434008 RepID=UPI00131639D5|nr:GNAT family N-acetyltransferase [Variovorax sp. PBS-H4]VTU27153.1 Acetyltransferase (GNAT) family protein [Variovorax sp. PBS-H4]
MSALQSAVGNARRIDPDARIARALMSVTADTQMSDSAAGVAMALQSVDQFRNVWPYLILALRKNHRLDRTRIAQTLSRLWSNSTEPWDADSLRGLARVANACFDISLSMKALHALRELDASVASDHLLEACCHAARGDLEQALSLSGTVLARAPHNKVAVGLHEGWTQRKEGWRGPWHVPVAGRDGLHLEPLHVEHAQALAWQYRDPAIAAKTMLPALEEPSAARHWIEHRISDRHVVPYALMHREHGFVGSVEITVSDAEAFLCIWVGTDWQGQGLGRQMVAMACEHAFRCGIETMLTAAYDSNTASLRTLRGCGFADVNIRAEPPDHDRTFLYLLAQPYDQDEIVRRLLGFSVRAETGLIFPAPASNDESATPVPHPQRETREEVR